MRGNFGRVFSLALMVGIVTCRSAWATERDFSVVTAQSSIAASGTVTTSVGTATIQPQGTGSLSTTYSGTIKTDQESASISFLSSTSVTANTNGSWKPDSSAADVAASADYGGKVSFLFGLETANFAGRDFVIGVTSGPISLDSGGHFDLSAATLDFVNGNLAYHDSSGQLIGTTNLANKTGSITGTGTLSSITQSGQTTETLNVPINATFVLMPDTSTTVNLTLTGQIVATTTFAAGLPGDYNQNGVVDAADYVLWRDKLGTGTALPNDDTTGVGNDDYARWRAQFGKRAAGSGSAAGAAVPEASTAALILFAFVGIAGERRFRR
ncbi:MAG TPA: hypothetical protein VH107_16775 [Lacipirellulaceae bacterium]|jgi:hypothetical protein|nr:hypothetical protein [Lacipirellulaceae bacterium]